MTYTVHPNVQLGKNVVIEPYAIIGHPPAGVQPGDLPTHIGDHSVIRSHTVIYAGTSIGTYFQTGHHALIREHSQIGHHVSVGSSSVVEHHVVLKDGVRIHSQAFICEYSQLESEAWIGPNVVFTNAKYPRYSGVKHNLKGVIVHKNAKIGANATLLPGIQIGQNSFIGAGSVVVQTVPPDEIWVGNPARFLKSAHSVGYPT